MLSRDAWPINHVLSGKYRIVDQLPSTDHIEYYQAQELHSPRDMVIIKRLRPEYVTDKAWRERFAKETIILRRLNHESILPIFDTHLEENESYIVTEYADKGNLKNYLDARPYRKLSPLQGFEIALSVCRGLEAIHAQGVIHCTLRPWSILLFSTPQGRIIAKIAEFSDARVLNERDNFPSTEVDRIVFSYTAPEQIKGDIADARSDIFAWALIFFEMLTGERPYESLINHDLLPLSDNFPVELFINKGVPREIAGILRKALHTDPAERFQSAREVRESLELIRPQATFTVISQNLNVGEAYIKAGQWASAIAEFEHGLESAVWHSETGNLRGEVYKLVERLTTGLHYAQGMMALANREWQAMVEFLEQVRGVDPNYLGINIAKLLGEVRSVQKLEEFAEKGQWSEVIQLAAELTDNYIGEPQYEIVREYMKAALYAQGQEFFANDKLQDAYHRFASVYKLDPGYIDIGKLSADTAFKISKRIDVPDSRNHRIRWLEKTLSLDPQHRDGLTQKQLDEERYRWAMELFKTDKQAAIAQLEKISSHYDRLAEASSLLDSQISKRTAKAQIQVLLKNYRTEIIISLIAAVITIILSTGFILSGSSLIPLAIPPIYTIITATLTILATVLIAGRIIYIQQRRRRQNLGVKVRLSEDDLFSQLERDVDELLEKES